MRLDGQHRSPTATSVWLGSGRGCGGARRCLVDGTHLLDTDVGSPQSLRARCAKQDERGPWQGDRRRKALVGAGSLITRDIPAGALPSAIPHRYMGRHRDQRSRSGGQGDHNLAGAAATCTRPCERVDWARSTALGDELDQALAIHPVGADLPPGAERSCRLRAVRRELAARGHGTRLVNLLSSSSWRTSSAATACAVGELLPLLFETGKADGDSSCAAPQKLADMDGHCVGVVRFDDGVGHA